MKKIYRVVFVILFMALISPVFSQHRDDRRQRSKAELKKSSHEPSSQEERLAPTQALRANQTGIQNITPLAATPNYYVTTPDEPWESSSNIDALNNSFGAGNWTRLNFTDPAATTIFTSATSFIFLEGSDDNANELNAFLAANISTIETWVHAGGRLLLNAAPNEGGNINFGFDGTTLRYEDAQDEVNIIGPIGTQPFVLTHSTYFGNSFSHSHVTGTGMNPLIMGSDKIVLAEKVWGEGIVLFGGMTTSNYHSPQPDADNLRANIMYYIANSSAEPTAPDAQFMISDATVLVNRQVSLIDISAHYPTSRLWTITPSTYEYLDGTNAQSNNPKLKFTAPGSYSITLTVSNDLGQDQLVRENYVTVSLPGNFYWVGGSGNWSDYATHWATSSGGSEFHTRIPNEEDNVHFDGNSFTGEGQIVNLGGAEVVAFHANFAGATYTPALTNGDLTISGGLNVPDSVVFSLDDVGFTSPDHVIINAKKANLEDASVWFYAKGTFDLASPLHVSYLEVEGGSVFTHGHTVTTEDLYIYDDLPAVIDFEGSELHVSETFEVYYDHETPTISGDFKLFLGKEGHDAYLEGNDLDLTNVTLINSVRFYDPVSFDQLTVTPGAVVNLGTYTHTVGSVDIKGTADDQIAVTNGTLSKTTGIVVATYVHLTNVVATGGASFHADRNSVDNGGNTGWNFSARDLQTITFNPLANKSYGTAPFALSASSTSALEVAFTVTSGPATISGNVLTVTGAGAVSVKASQDGDAAFLPAEEVTQTFTVVKAAQVLDFTIGNLVYGQGPVTLTATPGQSGNPVTFAIVSGPGTITNNTLTITGAGNLIINATQSGNDNYEAVTLSKSADVAKATQAVTFAPPTSKTFGDAPFDLTATGSATGNGIAYAIVSGPATLNASTLTITGAGTIVVKAIQTGSSNYLEASVSKEIEVLKANQAIDFTAIATKTIGDAAFNVSATGGLSANPVTFAIVSGNASISGATLTLTGTGTVTIRASQAGNANYNASADVERSFCVNPAKPIITVSGLDTEAPVLTSSSNDNNQWFNNGVLITGTSGNTFTVTEAGSYTVVANAGACISVTSDVQVLIITGVESTLGTKVSTYPNPVANELIVDLTALSAKSYAVVSVYDVSGRLMTSVKGSGTIRLAMEDYRQGQYTVVVHIGTQQIAKHIIKK